MRIFLAFVASLFLAACGDRGIRRVEVVDDGSSIQVRAYSHQPKSSLAPDSLPASTQETKITIPRVDTIVDASACVIYDSHRDAILRFGSDWPIKGWIFRERDYLEIYLYGPSSPLWFNGRHKIKLVRPPN